MNDKPDWQVAHLDDIERRGTDIPCASNSGSTHSESTPYHAAEGRHAASTSTTRPVRPGGVYIVLDGPGRPSRSTARRSTRRQERCVVRRAGVAAEGDRRRTCPRCRRHTRGGVPGGRLGRGVAVRAEQSDDATPANSGTPTRSKRSALPSSTCLITRASITTARAPQRSRRHRDETFADLRRSVELLPRFRGRAATGAVRRPRFGTSPSAYARRARPVRLRFPNLNQRTPATGVASGLLGVDRA